MKLSSEQIQSYNDDGFILVKDVFTKSELRIMLSEMYEVIKEDCPRRILEKNGSVRSFFAPNFSSDVFDQVVKLDRLVVPSKQLIGDNVYIHQTKINTKYAMQGDWWEWHQDYTFWKFDDGMPKPDVLTAMIFLNDVNEFNGPMILIPGSHKAGVVDETENPLESLVDDKWLQYQTSTTYMSALTSNLKYTLKQQAIMTWATKKGLFSAKGTAGSVLFFHGNVFHASSNNLSPWDRHAFLITYNSINNQLLTIENPRPQFIANRDFTPIQQLSDSLPETVQ